MVSIIIVNFNGKRYLKNCFDSLYNGSHKNIEIILVDNGSSDGSIEFIKENYPNVQIVDNKGNLGLSVASNRGAAIAKGDYLFFYNNDTIAREDLIVNLVSAMENNPGIGIAGCKTYTYDGKHLINAGVACDIFCYPYGKGKPFYVDAGIFIRRKVFDALGGFDENLFLYGEDRDICWRCWLYGYKVVVVDDAIFYHDSACITKDVANYKTSLNKRFLGEFIFLRSILKNYSLGFLFFILPLYVAINIMEIIIFLLRGDFNIIKNAYVRAYIENLKCVNDTFEKRTMVQKERKISDFELTSHMLKISGKLKLFMDMGIPKIIQQVKYGQSQR